MNCSSTILIPLLLMTLTLLPVNVRAEEALQGEVRHEAAMIPLTQMKAGRNKDITLTFSNRSSTKFRYFGGIEVHKERASPGAMRVELRRKGMALDPVESESTVLELEHNVQELPAGDSIDVSFTLPGKYGPLPPGRYSVYVTFKVKKEAAATRRFDLTPINLEKQVYWLDVEQ